MASEVAPEGSARTDPKIRVASVGILTYQRPDRLARTLASVASIDLNLVASSWQIGEVLIVDNDRQPTAKEHVERIEAKGFPFPISYVHEPSPGLTAARNRALDEASGSVLVFIDDDEVAGPGWPAGLFQTMARTGAALVGGPVRTLFTSSPPSWAADVFERPEPADDTPQTWLRSGNLAIDLDQVRAAGLRFDPAFGHSGGEDVAFSREAAAKGLLLSWSSSAVIEEEVGPERTTLRWVARRERRSTANWVRVELHHQHSVRRRLFIAARAAGRLAQGAVLGLGGLLTRRDSQAVRGLVMAARGVGSLQGLAGRAGGGYGTPEATSISGPDRTTM